MHTQRHAHRHKETQKETHGHSSSVHGNRVESTIELHRGMVEPWIVVWMFITYKLIHTCTG